MKKEIHLTQQDFLQIIANAPLVSIDLVITNGEHSILVGKRLNRPAQGSLFVPGGRIWKGETLDEAFARISEEEIGRHLERNEAEFIGVYEHFYEDNYQGVAGVPTHYVVLAYRIHCPDLDIETLPLAQADAQHERWLWLGEQEALHNPQVHPNTQAYFSQTGHLPISELVALYSVYQSAISSYTNIIWVFPAAFLALNVTAWAYLGQADNAWMLAVVAVVDLLFTQAFFKLVTNERAIIRVLVKIESALGRQVGDRFVPDFHSRRNFFMRLKSADWFAWCIAAVTVLAIVLSILALIR